VIEVFRKEAVELVFKVNRADRASNLILAVNQELKHHFLYARRAEIMPARHLVVTCFELAGLAKRIEL